MIRYALGCANSHSFESWFKSAAAYDSLALAGMVTCPECGSTKVSKALMAPGVQTARKAEARSEAMAQSRAEAQAQSHPAPETSLTAPRSPEEAALSELRRQIEANSEYVGMSFAAEARAIHEGESPERPIWGEAKADEAKALLDEGIAVVPLPFSSRGRSN